MRRCCASLGLILLSVWNVGKALTCRTTTRRYSAAPLRSLRSNRDLTGSSPNPACIELKLDDPLNEIVSRSKGHRPASASGHSCSATIADARLRGDARDRDGRLVEELAV